MVAADGDFGRSWRLGYDRGEGGGLWGGYLMKMEPIQGGEVERRSSGRSNMRGGPRRPRRRWEGQSGSGEGLRGSGESWELEETDEMLWRCSGGLLIGGARWLGSSAIGQIRPRLW